MPVASHPVQFNALLGAHFLLHTFLPLTDLNSGPATIQDKGTYKTRLLQSSRNFSSAVAPILLSHIVWKDALFTRLGIWEF